MYYLYEIKFPDGFFYVGITKNINFRFSQHKRGEYPVGIKIRDSGLSQNELFNIVHFSDSLSEILELEEIIVDKELLKNKKCLNLAPGGSKGGGFIGHKHSEKSKKIQSEKNKGRTRTESHKAIVGKLTKERMTGKKLPLEWKEKIRNGLVQSWKNPDYRKNQLEKMKGRTHSEETKNKISLSHQKGEQHHRVKKIEVFDKNNNLLAEYGSIVIASKFTGFTDSCISKRLRGIISQDNSSVIFKYK